MTKKEIETLLRDMEDYSRSHEHVYAIPREEAVFLNTLVRLRKPGRILELGTSSGYSAIWLGLAAASYGGKVDTVEFDPEKVKLATENIRKAGLEGTVLVHQADANEYLDVLEGQIAFVFMDTEKEEYLSQFMTIFPKLVQGGVLVADNAVDLADHMRDFLDYVKSLEAAQSVTVPIGNGVELVYKF